MSLLQFREMTEEYVGEIQEIYNYYILNTTHSFHTEPLNQAEIKTLVMPKQSRYHTYLIFQEDRLQGYVLLTQHKNRQAYDDCAEVTIYLKPDCVGRGIGPEAITFIEKIAKSQKFHTLVATICGDNVQSIRLFEKCGYFQCAHYREVGYKFGKWLDIKAFQKILS